MDRVIEKTKTQKLMKYWPHLAGGIALLVVVGWVVFGNHASTLRVSKDELTISEVKQAEFKDYVRTNGQVLPIQVVQISPEEGGIVMEKVVEEGSHVKKGDVIVRLSNSNLDLQILNAEAELAEKQNLLRNTQVAMQQDRLNNQTEQAQLDMDTQRKQRTFEQNKRLYGEKLISKEDYLQSQEDYQLSAKKRSLVSKRLKQDSIYRTVQMDQMEDNLQNMRRNVVLVRQRKDKLVIKRQRSRRQCRQPNGQICHAAHDRDVILIRTVIRTICKNACPHETKKHMIAWHASSILMSSGNYTIRTSLRPYMVTEE